MKQAKGRASDVCGAMATDVIRPASVSGTGGVIPPADIHPRHWIAADASPATVAAELGEPDPDARTPWEGTVSLLPRLKRGILARAAHSGRFREAVVSESKSAAALRAERRNARRIQRRSTQDGRFGPRQRVRGLPGLLKAVRDIT